MTVRNVHMLVKEIEQELLRDARGPRLVDLVGRYAREQDDWRDFALFDERVYARNLVHCGELFELLVICWNAGQKSPIHNHQGQRCWMAVLDGGIEETLFRLPEGARGGPLVTGASKTFDAGEVAFITDEIALHQISGANDRRAVTLHLYSRPIRQCQVYDRESGEITLRELAYYSVGGVAQAQPSVPSTRR